MSKTLEAVLDRYEKMAIERADLTAERDMARGERDHARDLCGKRHIELAKFETETKNLQARLERSIADGDALRGQIAAFRKEAEQKEVKFKELYETADALRRASSAYKTLHPVAEKLNDALKKAYDCLDWIPF